MLIEEYDMQEQLLVFFVEQYTRGQNTRQYHRWWTKQDDNMVIEDKIVGYYTSGQLSLQILDYAVVPSKRGG